MTGGSHRIFLLLAATLVGGAGAFGAACSSNDRVVDGTSNDGSVDSTTGENDSGNVVGDSAIGDAAPTETGSCGPIVGPACDVVRQDCKDGKECVVTEVNGALSTACVTPGTGNKPLGSKCCPNESNQCVAGLECIGPDCTDASGPTGRCTPHCCMGDDSVCGTSSPEGFTGACDLQIVSDYKDASVALFNVCSYKGVCKPFRLQPCPNNYACLLQSDNVSFRCSEIFNPPGKAVNQPCSFGNECADGLECLGTADASTCTQLCYRSDGGAPFDAAAVQDAAGYGGCPNGKPCNGSITGAPPWLGFCP